MIKHRAIRATKLNIILLGLYCAQGIPRGKADYRYAIAEAMGYSLEFCPELSPMFLFICS